MNETDAKQPGRLRAFFGRLGGWFKRHKKFTALLVVLALAAAILLRFRNFCNIVLVFSFTLSTIPDIY